MDTEDCGVVTLKHAVVGFPVPPSQGVPESQGLGTFVTLMDCHVAAAVQACFQGTSAWEKLEVYRRWGVSAGPNPRMTSLSN